MVPNEVALPQLVHPGMGMTPWAKGHYLQVATMEGGAHPMPELDKANQDGPLNVTAMVACHEVLQKAYSIVTSFATRCKWAQESSRITM